MLSSALAQREPAPEGRVTSPVGQTPQVSERIEELPKAPIPPFVGMEAVTTGAEGELASEDEQLREQGHKSRVPGEGENLLEEN